jgi:SAM-dependent methyltransferase
MNDKAKEIQGQDPKSSVFADLQPVLYAAETPVSGSYVASSLVTATLADALGGLRDKKVLDVGCGYGTTSAALANFFPGEIWAIDSSEKMVDLMKTVMFGDTDLNDWLRRRSADEVLGDLFDTALTHLIRRRTEFQDTAFCRSNRNLLSFVMSSMELLSSFRGLFDAVVGNNFLHWPVNQRKAELKKTHPVLSDAVITDLAVVDALRPIANVLKSGGVAVFMEPKDFITLDNDPGGEAHCEAHTMIAHPVFYKFNVVFNRLLKERYGIDRAIPKTAGLFPASRIPGWCELAGLKFVKMVHIEQSLLGDPLSAFYVRLPLWLGGLTKLSFDEKMALGKMTMAEMPGVLTAEDSAKPIQAQNFFICVTKE